MKNLFGEQYEYPPDDMFQSKAGKRKTKTMQEMFGTIPDKKCKDCANCERHYWNGRGWYKCILWNAYFKGSSEASDIRLKDTACKKYSSLRGI